MTGRSDSVWRLQLVRRVLEGMFPPYAVGRASFWQLRTFIPKIFLCEAYFVAEFVMFRLIKAKTPDLACAWHVRDTVLALNGCPFQKCNNLIVEHTGR